MKAVKAQGTIPTTSSFEPWFAWPDLPDYNDGEGGVRSFPGVS